PVICRYGACTCVLAWPIASVSENRTSIVTRCAKSPRRSRGSSGVWIRLAIIRRSVCRGDDERAGHPGLGVARHRAHDLVRAGLVDPESDLLRLTGTSSRVDVGEALHLPVVEHRVLVREGQHDGLAGVDANVGGR